MRVDHGFGSEKHLIGKEALFGLPRMIKKRVAFKHPEPFVSILDAGTFRLAASLLAMTWPHISTRILAPEAAR